MAVVGPMLFYFLLFTSINAFALLSTVIYRLYFHPLAKIPGPFLARCSTLWQNWCYWGGTWYDDILKVHEKYGPVVRINYAEVSFVDAEALKRIYGHNNPCKKVSPPHTTPLTSRRSGITRGYLRSGMGRSQSKTSKNIRFSVGGPPKHTP